MNSRCTVVLADDDDAFVTALTELLGTEPRITVLARASDGFEAVQLVQRLRPDIVLMDLQMPGTDGVEATAAIRERGLSTWVIVVSGTLSVSVGAALEAGANDFVPKTRVAEDLIDAVLRAGANTPV
jgi:two-component system response regulator DesR